MLKTSKLSNQSLQLCACIKTRTKFSVTDLRYFTFGKNNNVV